MPVKRITALFRVAKGANINAGFKYLALCQPELIIKLLSMLRQCGISDEEQGDIQRIETLASAAAGKRTISDEGMAFIEACKPEMVAGWCEKALSFNNLTAEQMHRT